MANRRQIREIVERYDDQELQGKYDCCGCSMPWDLYEALLGELKRLAGMADKATPERAH